MEMNRFVTSFHDVDVSDLKMPTIAVFYNPADMPGKYVARLFELQYPTDMVIMKNSLEEIRKTIPPHLHCIPRTKEDHPSVIEVWM